jgi:hypothetical protein
MQSFVSQSTDTVISREISIVGVSVYKPSSKHKLWTAYHFDHPFIANSTPSRQNRETMTGGIQDDVRQKFSPLHRAGGKSLVSQMLEIQACQIRQPSFQHWQQFTCLSIENSESTSARSSQPKNVLYRSKPPIADGNFVAISYRWRHACQNGSYQIAAGQGWKQKSSKVPDGIMDRVVRYVTHFNLSEFWIDQECIDQQDSRAKEFAIQSMDLVYRCSNRPLGILTTSLQQKGQLKLLNQMLLNEFVVMNDSSPQLAHWVKFWKARKLLNLLVYLMKDPWKTLDIPGRILQLWQNATVDPKYDRTHAGRVASHTWRRPRGSADKSR